MRFGFAHCTPDNVDGVDVAGALPEYADMRVAHQPGIDPLLNITIAAARFHRSTGS